MRKSWLLSLAAIATTTPALAKPMPDEFSYHFRNGVVGHTVLRLTGPNHRQVVKSDGEGLRITLPKTRQGSTGSIVVSPAFGLRGDCEVTLGFDLLSTEDPLPRWTGAGVVLMVEVAGPDRRAVSLSRLRWPGKDGGGPTDTFGASLITRAGGQDKYDTTKIPAASTTGRLRLERDGEVMRLSVADGAGGAFRLLREIPVGTADLHSLTAECRAASGGVDARLVDLNVRAESLIDEAVVTAPPRRFRWVPWAAGAVVLAGGVGWLLRRRARGEEQATPRSPGGPAPLQIAEEVEARPAGRTNKNEGERRG